MKNIFLAVLVCTIAILAFGQSYGSHSLGPIAPAVANCPVPPVGFATFCPVGTSAANYTMYISYNGAAYQLLVPVAPPAGVTSLNGKTGALTATATVTVQ